MATTAVASSTGPRYAPFDPTLPKPWRGLIDGKSGYLYFWNPVTNITQYERPSSDPIPDQSIRPDPPKSEVTSQGFDCDLGDLYRGNCSNSLSTGSPAHQGSSGAGNQAQNILNYNGSNVGTSTCSDIRLDESADSYRQKHEITVTGSDVPHPFTTFKSAGFPLEILREIQKVGFSDPTPIQAQSWPIALKKCDIVAVAKTGSGKTLGYLIPSFIHLKRCRNNPQLGPTVLVLSPTRELATQIHEEAVKFGKSSRISSTCLYGGAPKGPQLRDLDRGSDVVVATPGRLNDILEMKRISLNQVSYLVLDEADRMLDMGFEPQIRKIVEAVPTRRQTLMFTATWPKEVRKIAADLLVNPVQVNIGNADVLVANKSITQHVEVVFPTEKQCRLEQILRSQGLGSKVIVFCSTKRMCDQLAHKLTRQFGVAVIHGDKSQSERDYVLNQFRTGDSPILIATDVAARGLDVKDIRAVVNYDFPTGIEDYVHRIGRTGRAGATGVAYTFFCEQDSKYASDLIKILEESNQKVPPQLRDLALRGCGDRTSRVRSRWPSNHSDFSNRNLSNYNGGSGRNLQRSDSPDRDHQRKGPGDNQEYPDWSTCSYHEQHAARAHTRNHTRRSRSRSIERRQF